MKDEGITLLGHRRIRFFQRYRELRPLFFVLLLGLAISGCSQRNTTAHVPPAPTSSASPDTGSATSTPPSAGASSAAAPNSGATSRNPSAGMNPVPGAHVEEGMASWYGVPFHGRRASDGEIYDMYKFTAAHRTLPFNTMVRVTNLSNGQQVDVRIIDRGPFVEDRIIDLSLAAARAIDIVPAGTARVRLEIISGTPIPTLGRFGVQVGAFSDRANAERLRDQLAATYQPVSIQEFTGPAGELFRVRVGSVPNEAAARILAAKVQSDSGLEAFIVRLDDATVTPPTGGNVQP
jgi:rare lipoprotein A